MAQADPIAIIEQLALTPSGRPQPLSGGDIGDLWRVDTDQGAVVVKQATAYAIQAEADGLQALRDANTPLIIPELLGVFDDVLVMEYLTPTRGTPQSATQLGEGLRQLHANTADEHGWQVDNAAGNTRQINTRYRDGRVFQRECRLLPLGRACRDQGGLDGTSFDRLERLAHELENWLPDAPASLLHGDLWLGNVHFCDRGAALIDPAVYRHYPDVDIAALELFGKPPQETFEAYWDGAPPENWPMRRTLFQLYPLLNHLLMFGGGYRSAVTRAIDQLLQP
ncbi:fructosamine kinase family protein [Kushneria phosphatilytica]|uniref:Fructosamine kinase family protein n=1 Tax=Kushneria phosphatilytica TaxID=657387 RepID=A0A1S1NVI2_9GAMM|nr:fructosamine kinase family protein [Kushneria phosphatilytica]OHV11971.1 aminoglycoside phosphotransferase [Kushneria phosphatilytica]QEL11156.1 fructosamine kinase family protein [Kushneria phosphatilytica]